MAENLLTSSLQTKAHHAYELSEFYAENRSGLFDHMLGKTSYLDQIANLEAKEQDYYAAAETSSYEKFRDKIKETMSDDVANGLSQLGGAKLRKNLEYLRDQHLDETVELQQEITLIIDTYGLQKVNKGINSTLEELRSSLGGKNVSFTRQKGGKIAFHFRPDPRIVKELLNIFREQDIEGKKKAGRKYSTESSKISSAMLAKLSEMEGKYFYLADSDGEKRLVDTLKTSQKFLGYPWNFRKGDVELAVLQNDSAPFKQKLLQALEDIKDWLLELSGPDPVLRESITEEWDKVVGRNYSNLTNASFFLKGGYIELVVGAIGEFQVAVFQNFLGKLFPGMRQNYSASIQGNVFGEGTSEQAKADALFGNLGIQVKNYASPARKIEGNIHPDELKKYYDEERLYDSGFFGILANRFWIEFNGITTEDIAEDLNEAVGAILNLDALDTKLEDKISFYMIGGRYLVPASVILRHYADMQDDGKKKIEITSSKKPMPESQINSDLYWIQSHEGYIPSALNEKTFKNLLSHDISLRASFNYGNLPNLDKYALW